MNRSFRRQYGRLATSWGIRRSPFRFWMNPPQGSGPQDRESNNMHIDFRKLFAPPVFPEDEDKSRSAAILNTIGWSSLLMVLGILLVRILQANDVNFTEVNWILAATVVLIALILLLAHRGYVNTASVLFAITLWAALSYIAWAADGIRDIAFFAYTVPILVAGLLVGWRGAAVLTFASILAGWALAYAEAFQFFTPTLDTPLNFARDMTGVLLLIGILIYLMITSLQSSLVRSRSVTKELSASNRELNELRTNLQQQVETRTAELKTRASQLEAVSSVARAIASVQDLDTLLPSITKLVSQQFGFYHVGIFLLDALRQNAVLRAANSQGGLRMLSRQHSLALDAHSIVGYAVQRGEPRIAL